jgi:hypothetical protein
MELKNHKIIDIDKLISNNNHNVPKNLQRWQKLQELIKEEITLNEKSKILLINYLKIKLKKNIK